MPLLSLPTELLLLIAEQCTQQTQIYAMLRTCRQLHYLLRRLLLLYNVQYQKGSALIWAATRDRRNLTRQLLRLGAGVHTRGEPPRRGTPLHAAAGAGHVDMLKLLIKKGGDPEVSGARGIKPFHLALLARHEEAAIFLFGQMDDPNNRIAGEIGFTSLHAACFQDLPKLARVILESGADVHARTSKGNLSLHLALRDGAFGKPEDAIQSRIPELIGLLLEFGSHIDMKACKLGLWHSHAQVREIFQKHQACLGNAGEGCSRWQDVLDGYSTYSVLTRNVDTPAGVNLLDDESFPMLEPIQTSRDQQSWSSLWDPLRVHKIRQTLRLVENTSADTPSTGYQVGPFPKLIGRDSPHPLEHAAQLSWKELRVSRTKLVAQKSCATSKDGEQEERPQADSAAKKKKKWRPLYFS